MSVATDSLKSSFAMLGAMTTANLQDVTPQLAEQRPVEGANNAHWVLGHVVYWRSRMLEMLGGEPVWREGEYREFEGMQKGPPPTELGRGFEDLEADFADAQARTLEAVEAASDLPPETRDGLGSLVLHEAYHVGQLGLLRRTMGLEGAIGG